MQDGGCVGFGCTGVTRPCSLEFAGECGLLASRGMLLEGDQAGRAAIARKTGEGSEGCCCNDNDGL